MLRFLSHFTGSDLAQLLCTVTGGREGGGGGGGGVGGGHPFFKGSIAACGATQGQDWWRWGVALVLPKQNVHVKGARAGVARLSAHSALQPGLES